MECDRFQADVDFVDRLSGFEPDSTEYVKLWLAVYRIETGNACPGIDALAAWSRFNRRYHNDQGCYS